MELQNQVEVYLKHIQQCFATNWKALKKHPIEVWYNVYNFIVYGNRYTTDMSQKYRALYYRIYVECFVR